MYYGLRTNLPKEIMGYPDFPIEECDVSYVTSETIKQFLNDYANKFNLLKYIKFLHSVIRVIPFKAGWQVLISSLTDKSVHKYFFDNIMICTGHYHTPSYPIYVGAELFTGLQLHSHDFRRPEMFKGQKVLIVGAGPSGMDLCHKISKHAESVTLSHHIVDQPKTKFLGNVNQKPDIKKLDKNGAYFVDDSYDNFNIIFYCTGYKYSFPFLSIDCGIYVDENYVNNLYKHCINIQYPTMSFIGIPFYVCASQMMDIQSRFVLKYMTGEKLLPTVTDMLVDMEKEMQSRWKKGYKKRQAHLLGYQQMEYFTDLAETAEVTNIKEVMAKLHNESSERFLDDLLHFREDKFKLIDDFTFIKYN
ncbi:senecionine N-oxygenase isoform X2 [Teleopsis dalmanni]|nr:senecionine N-oxygenase isoform X2 [Teleopsis dalmanni]